MHEQCQRIRILWIDDCEEADAGEYAFPEAELPSDLSEWFQIIRHPNIPSRSSIRTPSDFWIVFNQFWRTGNSDHLPPEIIAMDYNLKKWRDPSAFQATGKSSTGLLRGKN